MWKKIAGKKTYTLGMGAILGAIGGMLTHTVPVAEGINTIITAVFAMTVRNGIK